MNTSDLSDKQLIGHFCSLLSGKSESIIDQDFESAAEKRDKQKQVAKELIKRGYEPNSIESVLYENHSLNSAESTFQSIRPRYFPRLESPNVGIIGIGGGGLQIVEYYREHYASNELKFVAVDTDENSLVNCSVKKTVLLGEPLCSGLGSGANPNRARLAAMYNFSSLIDEIKGCELVIIAVLLGGGTGTAVVGDLIRWLYELKQVPIVITSTPFFFEGNRRIERAENTLELLQDIVPVVNFDHSRLKGLIPKDETVHEFYSMTNCFRSETIKRFLQDPFETDLELRVDGKRQALVDYQKLLERCKREAFKNFFVASNQ